MITLSLLPRRIRKTCGHFGDERGLGLAESMVAVGLLGAGIITLVGALSSGSLAVNEVGQEVVAQRLAQAQLETMKAAVYDVTGASYSTVAAPAGYSVAFAVDSGIYGTNSIQKLTVTVSRDGTAVLTTEGYKVNR